MDKIVQSALYRYFKILQLFGYKSYKEVYKVLLLKFIDKFLKEFKEYITLNDIWYVQRALFCLNNSICLIQFDSLHQFFIEYCKDIQENQDQDKKEINIYYDSGKLVIENYDQEIKNNIINLSYDNIEVLNNIMFVN